MQTIINSQEEMEQVMRDYFAQLPLRQIGSFNIMMAPELRECSYAEKSLTLAFHIQPWMVNPNGGLHGGIAGAAMDIVMGILAFCYCGGVMSPTVSMTMDYLRTITPSHTLITKAYCTKVGKAFCRFTASAWDEEKPGKLIFTSTGTYYNASNA